VCWAVRQRAAAIPYRRFGTIYRSHVQGSRVQKESWSSHPTSQPTTQLNFGWLAACLLGLPVFFALLTLEMGPTGCPKRRQEITIACCVMTQKNADLFNLMLYECTDIDIRDTLGNILTLICGPGSSVGIATELRARRSGIESRWGRDFSPVQTGPRAHSASCKMGTGSFPGVKCGRGVLLTTHPLLVPPVSHTGPVTDDFTFCLLLTIMSGTV